MLEQTHAAAAQTRLPVFAHESAAEHKAYAQDFVERCQQDSAVFGEAVLLLSEVIDLPRADALVTLRWGPGLGPPVVLITVLSQK